MILALAVFACGKPDKPEMILPTYQQDFKTDVAWIVLEWNGKPTGGWGSGFLVDRQKGLFYTNKHVSEVFNALGQGSHKMFFNGKVYNIKTLKTEPLVDAALVRITDKFDSSEFPEPARFVEDKLKVGDRVVVEGFHVHPYAVRQVDEEAGYKYPTLTIFSDYYKMPTKDITKEQEIVFERLEAQVTAIEKKIAIGGQGSGVVQNLRNTTNSYVEIKTKKDHLFSFAGLSGTVVRNEQGETVGIFTAGPEVEVDPDTGQKLPGGITIMKRVFRTAYLTPIQAVNLK